MGKNKHIKDVVTRLIKKWEKSRTNKILKTWEEALGEEAKHTKPVKFDKGTLVVVVENSSLLYKLTIEKRKILECFNKRYTGKKKIKDIRYRVGVVEE